MEEVKKILLGALVVAVWAAIIFGVMYTDAIILVGILVGLGLCWAIGDLFL